MAVICLCIDWLTLWKARQPWQVVFHSSQMGSAPVRPCHTSSLQMFTVVTLEPQMWILIGKKKKKSLPDTFSVRFCGRVACGSPRWPTAVTDSDRSNQPGLWPADRTSARFNVIKLISKDYLTWIVVCLVVNKSNRVICAFFFSVSTWVVTMWFKITLLGIMGKNPLLLIKMS